MNTDRYQRIHSVFEQALDKDESARGVFLNEACRDDPQIRREVEALLVEADRKTTDDFLQPLPFSIKNQLGDDSDHSLVGHQLGPYRIDERIGRGGMGNVYLATRISEFQQRVAIKVIKRGMDTEQVLQRFHNEMQFSAALGKHSHIAAILDGGTTDDGRPYFVMEYVEGDRIDRYCDQNELRLRQRLELVQQVCSAIQHAHQHTIIHRDLKPSNIMITDQGVPKLIDFGIAKWLSPAADSFTAPVTDTAHRFLTPEYASPEQIRGESLTTATDVYSLGVILYELLTGRKPYRTTSRSPADLRQVIEHQEPARPSTAVRQDETQPDPLTDTAEDTARHTRRPRREAPRRLQRMLAGDLDNIVLMTLRKEPSRRYGSVEQLSADIQRYLDGLPVQARKDTWQYRATKWIRRHRLAVTAAAIVTICLVGGIIGTTTQARRALRHAERADAINSFLVNDFVRASDGYFDGDPNMSLYDAVQLAADRLKTAFTDQPETKAELHHIVGQSLLNLGRYHEALEHFDLALGLYENLPRFGPEHHKTIETLALKGDSLDTIEAFDEALVVLEDAWHRAEMTLGPQHPLTFLTMGRLGETLQTISKYEQAEPILRRAHELSLEHLEASDPRRYTALNSLGELLRAMGRHEESEPLRKLFFQLTNQHLGPSHPSSIGAMNALAGLYYDQARIAARNKNREEEQRRLAMAEPIFQQLVTTASNVLPEDHLTLAVYQGNYGACLAKLGRHSQAEPHVLQSVAICYVAAGPDQDTTEQYLRNSVMFYADWLNRSESADERAALIDKWQKQLQSFVALRATRAELDTKDNDTPYWWSKFLIEMVDLAPQASPVDALLQMLQERTPDLTDRANYWGNVGILLAKYDRAAPARSMLQSSYELRADALGIEHAETQWMLRELVSVSERLGESDDAMRYRELLTSPLN